MNDLAHFEMFLGAHCSSPSFEDITARHVRGFVRQRLLEHGESQATVSRRFSNVKYFIDRTSHNLGIRSAVRNLKISFKLANRRCLLTPERFADIVRVASEQTPFLATRDTALIQVFANTGLRREEVSRLRINQFCPVSRKLLGVLEKGDKVRDVELNNTALRAIEDYLEERIKRLEAHPSWKKINSKTALKFPLFISPYRAGPSPKSWAICDSTIARRIKAHSGRAGFKVTPHMLRHYFAVQLLERCNNLKDVSEALGHSSTTTTEKYLDSYINHSRRAVDALDD